MSSAAAALSLLAGSVLKRRDALGLHTSLAAGTLPVDALHADLGRLLARKFATNLANQPNGIADLEPLPVLGRRHIADGRLDAALALALDGAAGSGLAHIALGTLYERLLHPSASYDARARKLHFAPAQHNPRRRSGSYYTPPELVALLLAQALDPLIEGALASRRTRPAKIRALLALRVLDPACGCGHFLSAAARRLANRLAEVEGKALAAGHLARAAQACLYGVDLDAGAAELCRLALWIEAGCPGSAAEFLAGRIKRGDSLLGAAAMQLADGIPQAAYARQAGDDPVAVRELRRQNRVQLRSEAEQKQSRSTQAVSRTAYDAWCAAFVQEKLANAPAITTAQLRLLQENADAAGNALLAEVSRLQKCYGFFHWTLKFPEVFSGKRPGFDAVIGNPPFVNVQHVPPRLKQAYNVLQPQLGGTADMAARFMARGLELTRDGGRLGLVQPRTTLNTPSLDSWRAAPGRGFVPALVYVPGSAMLFPGAAVFVCLLVLAQDAGKARLARGSIPRAKGWPRARIGGANWWAALLAALAGKRGTPALEGTPLGQLVQLAASMITSDAYDALPFLADNSRGRGFKLITTGLIDPGQCLWGQRACRYLGRDYRHPRITPGPGLTRSLERRLALAARPKLLIAGLSKRLECFVDGRGECTGATSTYTLLHHADDVAALDALADWLHCAAVQAHFDAVLGANALGGGNVTVKKRFLLELPVPDKLARLLGGRTAKAG